MHFFFNDTATTEIYTLSLHDALPIFEAAATRLWMHLEGQDSRGWRYEGVGHGRAICLHPEHGCLLGPDRWHVRGLRPHRSEEHTSELQSHLNLVCRLLLVKKKVTAAH